MHNGNKKCAANPNINSGYRLVQPFQFSNSMDETALQNCHRSSVFLAMAKRKPMHQGKDHAASVHVHDENYEKKHKKMAFSRVAKSTITVSVKLGYFVTKQKAN